MQPTIANHLHPFFKLGQIVYQLRLHKISARGDFLCQAIYAILKRIGKRVYRSTNIQSRHHAFYLLAILQCSLVTDILDHP